MITVDPASGEAAERVQPLVRSRGAEVGLRAAPTRGALRGLRSTVSVWALNLDSELLFTGDAGNTEPAAASRRRGVTFANFWRPVPALSVDADVSFARARFHNPDGTVAHVPGALEHVVAGGVAWGPVAGGVAWGPFAALRVRHFGSYPLVEDNGVRARAATLVAAAAGVQLARGARLQLSVLNLLDARADDIQYYHASRLAGEARGVGDVHAHPAEPRQVRLGVGWQF